MKNRAIFNNGTILHTAARDFSDPFFTSDILQRNNTREYINKQDENGNTAFHLAIELRNLPFVKQLFKYKEKIDFSLQNIHGETALSLADFICRDKHPQSVDIYYIITEYLRDSIPFEYTKYINTDALSAKDPALLCEKDVSVSGDIPISETDN